MKYIIALILSLVATPVFAQGKTINQLLPGQPLTGSELFPMFQGFNPAVTTSPNAIKTYIIGSSNTFTSANTFSLNGAGNTPLSIRNTFLTPINVLPSFAITSDCLGNNTTFIGCSNGSFIAGDDATVTTGTKGVLYGLQLGVIPLITRNNSPADDADGLIVANNSSNGSKATEAITVTAGGGFTSTFTHQWGIDMYAAPSADVAVALGGGSGTSFNYGVDACYSGTCPIYANAAFRATNNIPALVARSASGGADIQIATVDSGNNVQLSTNSNVGIGTGGAAPTVALDVGAGTAGIATVNRLNGCGSGSSCGSATFYANNGSTFDAIGTYSSILGGAFNDDFLIYSNDFSTTSGSIRFVLQSISTSGDAMTLSSSGLNLQSGLAYKAGGVV